MNDNPAAVTRPTEEELMGLEEVCELRKHSDDGSWSVEHNGGVHGNTIMLVRGDEKISVGIGVFYAFDNATCEDDMKLIAAAANAAEHALPALLAAYKQQEGEIGNLSGALDRVTAELGDAQGGITRLQSVLSRHADEILAQGQEIERLRGALTKIANSKRYCFIDTPVIDALENLQVWVRELQSIASEALNRADVREIVTPKG